MTLYEQLKSGTRAEDIAAAFAKELNEAEERIKAEEEAELKRLEEEQKRNEKRADVVELLDSAIYVLSTYYPSFGINYDEVSAEDLDALADLVIALLDLEDLKPAKRSFKLKSYKAPEAKVETPAVPAKDDPFALFFKTFGL